MSNLKTSDKKPTALRLLSQWWPSMVTAALILWLTLTSDPVPDVQIPSWLGKHADKIVHAIMFGGLTGALIFDYKRRNPGAPHHTGTVFLIMLGVAIVFFGCIDEWLQDIMGLGRTADLYDVGADIAGIVCGLLLAPPVCDFLIRRWIIKEGKP